MTYGRGIPIYGDAATPWVLGCIKLITPYYLELSSVVTVSEWLDGSFEVKIDFEKPSNGSGYM
jgi:hypothetical protein